MEEAVEDLAEAVSQEDVKAEVLVDTEGILVVEIAKVVDTEEILVEETVKAEVVSDQELHQLAQAIEDLLHLILAIAEEEVKGVRHHLKVVQQKEEVLALIAQKELQEDQTTNFLV